jgi:hypothetical protein
MTNARWTWLLVGLMVGCGARQVPPPRAGATPGAATASVELGDRVGTSHFPTSCAAGEAQEMDRAVALLHSFFYDEARRRFALVAGRDPSCAMAHWGVAMTLWHPLWQAPRPDELAQGVAAIQQARALGPKTPREDAYVGALEAFYFEPAGSSEPASQSCHGAVSSDHKKGAQAYEAKMAALVARFPDDVEAEVFHALALLAVHPPTDATLARPRQAAATLEKLFPTHPGHPGIAHYLIHAYDFPPLAEKGLPAARVYASMAPWVPHALHMPSHIFTRLGMWNDSIGANLAAAAAARKYEARFHPGAHAAEEVHALDYLAYAYLQTAQDRKANELVAYLGTIDRTNPDVDLVAGYPFATIPARYALERRSWKEAAALAPSTLAMKLPFVEANLVYARAIGAARSGDRPGARAAVARLGALRDAIQDPKYAFFGKQVELQRIAGLAWLLHAENKESEALAQMRVAADLEDAIGKHPATPGAVLPVREQLGDLLLEQGQAAAALAEHERSLAAAPNRLSGLHGAAHAAELAGDRAKARAYYQKLVDVAAGGDARPEVVAARAWLASAAASPSSPPPR